MVDVVEAQIERFQLGEVVETGDLLNAVVVQIEIFQRGEDADVFGADLGEQVLAKT